MAVVEEVEDKEEVVVVEVAGAEVEAAEAAEEEVTHLPLLAPVAIQQKSGKTCHIPKNKKFIVRESA
jgi:hypothetical protein